MERVMSVEDKIRRAEAIYNKRRENQRKLNTTTVNINSKKNVKIIKKMIIQIMVCLLIYSGYYMLVNNNYIFSEDLKNKTKEILSYDINIRKIYDEIANQVNNKITKNEEVIENVETKEEVPVNEEITIEQKNEEEKIESTSTLTQEEKDIVEIKSNINFISPIHGTITSKFGWRDTSTKNIPKYHTGIDIAAQMGTIIKSATDGEVILSSTEGDYGNHLKIKKDDVIIVYAHCKSLYVKEGENVKQGQEIAEVGTTGNSTGPHLHFEIRKEDRLINPESILEI